MRNQHSQFFLIYGEIWRISFFGPIFGCTRMKQSLPTIIPAKYPPSKTVSPNTPPGFFSTRPKWRPGLWGGGLVPDSALGLKRRTSRDGQGVRLRPHVRGHDPEPGEPDCSAPHLTNCAPVWAVWLDPSLPRLVGRWSQRGALKKMAPGILGHIGHGPPFSTILQTAGRLIGC